MGATAIQSKRHPIRPVDGIPWEFVVSARLKRDIIGAVVGVLEGAPKYLVHQQLSAGGMGAVHLGTIVTQAGERRVAVKRLHTNNAGAPEDTERMIAEARLVFLLTHANICQVLDLASNDAGTFIVMEHIDGCDLGTLLRSLRERGQTLELASAVHIIREVAQALDYAHRRCDSTGRPLRLVHGDVKPPNILLSKESEVKLADFGIARTLVAFGGTQAPGNRLQGGTPGYMAPEVSRGGGDQRSDIFSLGMTLYVALGGTASGAMSLKILGEQRPEISSELLGILERATARRPEDRFATVAEFERALGLHLAHKFPSFSRSTIAELVRAHSSPSAVETQAESPSLTLASLTHLPGNATITNAPLQSAFTPSSAPPQRTQQAGRAGREARRRDWRIGAAILLAVASAIAFRPWRAIRSPAAAIAQPPPANQQTVTPTPTVQPQPPPAIEKRAPAVKRMSVVAAKNVRHAKSDSVPLDIGYLSVNAEPWGTVLVDGKKIADQTPAYRLPLAVGNHRVTVYNPDRHSSARPKTVDVRPGQNLVVGFEW